MTTIEKLHEIERLATIYTINWRIAGVGITFFEQARTGLPPGIMPDNAIDWRRGLITYHYHPTLEACIDAEYARLTSTTEQDSGLQATASR